MTSKLYVSPRPSTNRLSQAPLKAKEAIGDDI
jgi:hypothetical protein